MPYVLTQNSIDRVKHILDEVCNTKQEDILRVKTPSPVDTRFLIHQGIAAARELSVEPYASLNIRIVKTSGALLISHKADPLLDVSFEREERPAFQQDNMVLDDEVDHIGVVALLTQHQVLPGQAITFRNFAGRPEILKTWADNTGYDIVSESPLTLRKKTTDG